MKNRLFTTKNTLKITDLFKSGFIYVDSTKNFYIYQDQYWVKISIDYLTHIIYTKLINIYPNTEKIKIIKDSKIIISFIKVNNQIKDQPNNNLYQNFNNGILNQEDKTLSSHNPLMYFDYKIHYNYEKLDINQEEDFTILEKLIPNIQNWQLFISKGDKDLIIFILSYIACVIRRDSKYQIYLELVGPGGTGKSTLMNLIAILVGSNNVHISDMNSLETNRFETANIKGKALILITDASQYSGRIEVLKALLGQDFIRFEEKGKQAGNQFVFTGLLIIATNEPLQFKDLSSGLGRRRIIIYFTEFSDVKKLLIGKSISGEISGLFKPELDNLFNICINLELNTIDKYKSNPKLVVNAINQMYMQNLIATNSVAAFIYDNIKIVSNKCPNEFFLPLNSILPYKEGFYYKYYTLYGRYKEYCLLINAKPLGVARFGQLLHDNLKILFPEDFQYVIRDEYNGIYYKNLIKKTHKDNFYSFYDSKDFISPCEIEYKE